MMGQGYDISYYECIQFVHDNKLPSNSEMNVKWIPYDWIYTVLYHQQTGIFKT